MDQTHGALPRASREMGGMAGAVQAGQAGTGPMNLPASKPDGS